MVVCSSRPHAVRFWQALCAYVREHGLDVGVLVAFSDTVTVDGEALTESRCNGFPDTQTAERFDTDDFQIMVVAEKFQTGFDQPKLYAMYVDKTLTGLAAVQTLSRLNRIHPDKDGTFVLDFVNDAEDVAAAFEPYYGRTVAAPSDPNLLYDTRHALDEFGVLNVEEATTFVRILLAERADHGRLYAALGPGVDRFGALEEDEQERFRDALGRFVRVYSFLSQVVSFGDTDLERDYLYAKALAALIRSDPGAAVDLSGAVELTHLRNEQRFAGSVSLDGDGGDVTTPSGTGPGHEPEPEPLSVIIDRLNQLHGTDWTAADRLVFDAALEDLVASQDFQLAAVNNTAENFGVVFPELFQQALIGRMDRNEKVVFKYLDDAELAADVQRIYGTLARARARVAYQQHCPIGELLDAGEENDHLEFKSSLRTGADSGEVIPALETAVLKTVAAFLNSREGGTLLVGVRDDGTVHGLDGDYASLHKEGKDDRDRFLLHLNQLLINSVKEAAASTVTCQLHTLTDADGERRDLCRVHAPPSSFPVDAEVKVDKGGGAKQRTAFYVRIGNGTREITDPDEKARYIAMRWSAAD